MVRPLMLSGIEKLRFLIGEWVDSGDEVVASFVTAATGEGEIN
jgi:hypothetical protein